MGSFNENAFMIAGTAIAIFGVGLYIYDTRKDKVVNSYNQYRQSKNNYAAAPAYPVSTSNESQGLLSTGGSRKNKKRFLNKKQKKTINSVKI
jgi:hypothetical protein